MARFRERDLELESLLSFPMLPRELLAHELAYIEVTAQFKPFISVTLTVHPSTPTHEFIRLATSKTPQALQSKKFILFHNERVLSSGTLAENGIFHRASVHLVEDKPVLINFEYPCGKGRTRVFPVEASADVTILSLKAHLARTLSTECPAMDTTNHAFEISDEERVLPDDVHPVQPSSPRIEHCKTYTVHLLSRNVEYIRMKLLFHSHQTNEFAKAVLFVPENSTYDQLRKEVARVTSFPLDSILIGTIIDDISNDDAFLEILDSREALLDPVELPLDAAIRDHPIWFHNGCMLQAKEELPFNLQVKADVHNTGEFSLLMLKVHSYDTVGNVVQAIAEKMAVDPRLVRFSSDVRLAETIHERIWNDGDGIDVDVFPRGAAVTIFHKDEAFRYETFVQDTATTKASSLQAFVEKKHSFHPGSVVLYHQGRLLDPDASLSSAGVGMGSTIMVSTNKPGEAGADSNQAPAIADTSKSLAARAPSTKHWTTIRKRLMQNRLFPRQRLPKRLKPTSQRKSSSRDNDNETRTGSKALVVRAARKVVAADVSEIQLQDTTQSSEEATPDRAASNPTRAFQVISLMDEMEQNTNEAVEGCGMRAARTTSEINSGSNRLEVIPQFQQILQNLTSIMSKFSAITGSQLAIEQAPQPTSQVVTEEALRRVAEELGSEWDAFASRGLRLSYADIEAMRRRHLNCLYLQALGAVHKWQQSQGSQATKAALQQLLKDNGFLSIAELIEKI